jgi:hypothetical protein
MNIEEAEAFLIRWLRDPAIHRSEHSRYGYDLYLPNVIRDYLSHQRSPQQSEGEIRGLSPHFYAAGWDLCRRGILRPGIRIYGEQATADGASGNGYSITPFGQKWLAESDQDDFVPTEPGRFAQMLERYRERFGPTFYERAQEAVKCYGAHAYLACCVMCGASAESILLATAICKQDKDSVLAMYNTAQGRSRIENLLIGQVREQLQREFRGFLTLLKYWRDEASHGQPSQIGDNEALTSLAFLLRFASFVDDHWKELVGSAE